MIHLTAETQILLAIKPADFRFGIDGFAALCRNRLKKEPRNGTLFVFTNHQPEFAFRQQQTLQSVITSISRFESERVNTMGSHFCERKVGR